MKKAVKAKKAVKKITKKTARKNAKSASKKTVSKKKAKAKKAKPKAKKSKASGANWGLAVLGCCTLTGSGPDIQFEGITAQDCRQRGIALGKNDHWVPGKCAEPD